MTVSPSSTKWFIGTIGFGYNEWQSIFYPKGMKSQDYLGHYSRIFNAVEIDSTFHAVPKPEILVRWAANSPGDFKFCLKIPQTISHSIGLSVSDQELMNFFRTADLLHEKLGPILVQFPPSFRAGQLSDLERFLSRLPAELRFAVEVRHLSWYTPEANDMPALADLLRKYRVCWAATEYPGLPSKIWPTTDFAFIRWIGQHGSFTRHTQVRLDRQKELQGWIATIQENLDKVKEIYGFFNNDYSGFAPGTANRFKELIGLTVESFGLPQQGKLF